MSDKRSSDHYTDEETAQRRDEVIKHMLSTPPKAHSALKAGKRPRSKAASAKRDASAKGGEPSA